MQRRENNHTGPQSSTLSPIVLLVILAIAVIGGVLIGNHYLKGRGVVSEEGRRVDEYQGLGERTGLTGDLTLMVDPMAVTVKPGEPVNVNLTLTNQGKKRMLLNGWLTPAPAKFESNQLPFKVKVSKDGYLVPFRGDPVLLPLHTRDDFFELGPGQSRVIPLDLTQGAGGRWDMSSPGDYAVEIWYETYLSGKYIGVRAWTGMTNHVVVRVRVAGGQ